MLSMKIIKNKITRKELKEMAEKMFGNLVKGVVDVKKEILVVDGELHADEETLFLSQDSKQENLWGINLYPDLTGDDWIEFDSMINIKPALGNRSRGIDDKTIQQKIIDIVNKRIEK